jgi:cyclic pyranopterin phosphate synthase
MAILDTLGRPLRNLRISVTDRCNLRCHYCMPEADYVWLPREDVLSFEEIGQVADLVAEQGVDRVRLTGGEPLLRRNLPDLVSSLAGRAWLRDFALTTNGVLLADVAADLKRAGLHRLTVSLDTLRRDRFHRLTRMDALPDVLEGLDAARRAGFTGLKLDAVITRGDNDDEIGDLVAFARDLDAEIRFIEYMDVGGATEWSLDKVFTRAEMLDRLGKRYGTITPLNENSSAPAERFRLPDGTVFGIIASTTTPFCRSCDRSRLTADGLWYLCLYAQAGIDLRQMLRAGVPAEEIAARISSVWRARADRGAELRAATGERGVLVGIEQLRQDPHLEMHTRGG